MARKFDIHRMIMLLFFFQVVHNYGHGGYGVSMAPGTAMESVDTAIKLHKATSSKI